MVYEDERYRKDLQMYLQKIKEQTSTIESILTKMDCCILSNFEQLQRNVSEALNIASSYYLQSYLSPFTKEYTKISLAAHRLSEKRHGALIIVERKDPLHEYIHNGIPIDAKISPTLLETIFYPGNPLHDGGMLLKKDKIVSAANILPVANISVPGKKIGTRHRAALGLTEKTDAVVIVVSEETGRISFAFDGNLYVVRA